MPSAIRVARRKAGTTAGSAGWTARATQEQLLSLRRSFGLGFLLAAMAGVAGHVHLAVGESGVDVIHHRDHHARDILFGVIVAGKIALHVAEGTLHAQAGGVGSHDSAEFRAVFDLQNFDVRGAAFGLLSFVLSKGRNAQR
jgi:hypothetical protein